MSNIIKLPGVPVDPVELLEQLLVAARAGEIKGVIAAVVMKSNAMAPMWTPMDASHVYLGGAVIQDHAMSVLRGAKPLGYENVREKAGLGEAAPTPPIEPEGPASQGNAIPTTQIPVPRGGLRLVQDNDKDPA